MKRIVRLYTVMAKCAIGASLLAAQTVTTLYSFCDQKDCVNDFNPNALVQATNGNLYGTTVGAQGARTQDGTGTVFKITPNGTFKTLYVFCSQAHCPDGRYPNSLVLASNSDLYGTTQNGGAHGAGTIFKITPSGALTTVYNFCHQVQSGVCTDGRTPMAGLVQAASGDLYGTTENGGLYKSGTIFKITPSRTFTTLYSFCAQTGCPDGAAPTAGLVQAGNGDLYGTTIAGGAISTMDYGGGTIFKITPSGAFTSLYSFCAQTGCPDGATPMAGLVQATDSDFYGTTQNGGAGGGNYGTIFKISPAGTFTRLYSFCLDLWPCSDGALPQAPVVQATDGDFYGTTSNGAHGSGTLFKIDHSGALLTLYSFCTPVEGCPNGGAMPVAGLMQATNGSLYGTSESGGAYNGGTIFELSVGLGAFVKTLPTSGKLGETVTILGSDLTGATNVMFNGTASVFNIVSAREITTAVPTGATTGKVEVVTPLGTLSSNVSFEVVP